MKCKIGAGVGVWIEDVGPSGYVMRFTFAHLDQMSDMASGWLDAVKPWKAAERKERRKLRDRERRQNKKELQEQQRRAKCPRRSRRKKHQPAVEQPRSQTIRRRSRRRATLSSYSERVHESVLQGRKVDYRLVYHVHQHRGYLGRASQQSQKR